MVLLYENNVMVSK